MNQFPTTSEIKNFLAEDIGSGDITASIIPASTMAEATVINRDAMILCGQAWFDAVFLYLNPEVSIHWLKNEGDYCKADTILCELSGPARVLLTAERTALNLLQTLCYTATIANQYARAVDGTNCKVLDTRKTIPGLRNAQKYAVACGGCVNHRIGLYDAVLIKENHILAAGSIEQAVSEARRISDVLIEVEVESLDEYQQALKAGPDRIMLDNFSIADMKTAVANKQGDVELEASGDINLENIRNIAETGVDYISIGALTKNVQAINLSMRVRMQGV